MTDYDETAALADLHRERELLKPIAEALSTLELQAGDLADEGKAGQAGQVLIAKMIITQAVQDVYDNLAAKLVAGERAGRSEPARSGTDPAAAAITDGGWFGWSYDGARTSIKAAVHERGSATDRAVVEIVLTALVGEVPEESSVLLTRARWMELVRHVNKQFSGRDERTD
jgi:hypothetical protein